MNTIRMFAFIVAVLITAVLFRAVADGFSFEQPVRAATAAHGASAAHGPQSAAH
jgi:hypothetical protein